MKHFLLLLLVTSIFTVTAQETHVFLLAGQSNMVGRANFDSGATHPSGTLQWGRVGGNNNTLIPATIPLQHHDPQSGHMGLDVQFAIDYLAENPGVTLVLIPSAKGGTGFASSGQWRVGDALYNDAVNRVNACMAANPSFIFKGIIWHQGERDRNNVPSYYSYYDNLINSFRNDITVADTTTPFICGGLLPSFISLHASGTDVELVQAYLEDTPNRIPYTAYVDNTGFVDKGDNTHANAATLRLMGIRYFQEFRNLSNTLSTSDSNSPVHKVFPNPTEKDLVIKSKGALIEHITVFNTLGEKVQSIHNNGSEKRIKINLPQALGIYLVHIKNIDGSSSLKKVIKM